MKSNYLIGSALRCAAGLTALWLLQSCTKLDVLENPTRLANVKPDKGAIELHYEIENLTYQELDKGQLASAFDKIHAMANAHRSKIDLQIYEDGSSDWIMTKMTPKHDVKVIDLTPTNPMPQTRTTHVDRSGMGFFYGNDGNLLYKHAVPTKPFGDLVAQVRKYPDAIYTALGIKSKQRIDELIANAKRNGAVVTDLGNGNISVRQPVAGAGSAPASSARASAANYKLVDIINTNLNVVVGSSLYDEKETLINRVYYSYKLSEDKKLVPEAMHMKTWTRYPRTGQTVVTISNTYFDNVSESVNLN